MSEYFVDFENVGSAGLSGISKSNLNATDVFYVFYSDNSKNITIDLYKEIQKVTAKIIFVKVKVGSANALDFQLSSYLGYLIKENPEKKFFIISKDKGYDSVCDFWKGRQTVIKRIDSINSIDRDKDAVAKALTGIVSEKDALKVYNIICNLKTKQGINNNLMKSFPSDKNEKASKIYKAIKPFITDKK